MKGFAPRLTKEIKLNPEMADKLATTIAADVRFLSPEQKAKIRAASPVPLQNRLAELHAFQVWMDQARAVHNNPLCRSRSSFDTELHLLCLSARGMLSCSLEGVPERFCYGEMRPILE